MINAFDCKLVLLLFAMMNRGDYEKYKHREEDSRIRSMVIKLKVNGHRKLSFQSPWKNVQKYISRAFEL